MTEPEVSGADPTNLQTRAIRDGDEWVINGHKWFTSQGDGATFAIVMCATELDQPPHRRMSQIVVPADTPGFKIVRPVPVMGETDGSHCEVRYDDVRVPITNVLGEAGGGFRIAQKRLGPGRIHHCMRWLGQMQRAFEIMIEYSLEREVYGSTLSEKQTMQNWIADSYVEIQACAPADDATPRTRSTRATRRASRSRRSSSSARRCCTTSSTARSRCTERAACPATHRSRRCTATHAQHASTTVQMSRTAWWSRGASCRASRPETAGTSASKLPGGADGTRGTRRTARAVCSDHA